jgi:hypothetical protein
MSMTIDHPNPDGGAIDNPYHSRSDEEKRMGIVITTPMSVLQDQTMELNLLH